MGLVLLAPMLRQCVSWLKYDSLRFWQCTRDGGMLDDVFQKIACTKLVARARALLVQDVDHGHDLVKIPLQ